MQYALLGTTLPQRPSFLQYLDNNMKTIGAADPRPRLLQPKEQVATWKGMTRNVRVQTNRGFCGEIPIVVNTDGVDPS